MLRMNLTNPNNLETLYRGKNLRGFQEDFIFSNLETLPGSSHGMGSQESVLYLRSALEGHKHGGSKRYQYFLTTKTVSEEVDVTDELDKS